MMGSGFRITITPYSPFIYSTVLKYHTYTYDCICKKELFLLGPTKIRHGEFIRQGYAMGVFARHSCIIAMK